MYDQLFDTYRKMSESWMQVQQDMLRTTVQQWATNPPNTVGATTDWTRTFQKKSIELVIEFLNRQREAVDSSFRSMIQLIEQSGRIPDAKSSEDYRRVVE